MNTQKCSCGKLGTHLISKGGETKNQCCECYVKDGNPPADWHDKCIKTYKKMKGKK